MWGLCVLCLSMCLSLVCDACACAPTPENVAFAVGVCVPPTNSGDLRVFEVELSAAAAGDVNESLEFLSSGFSVVLTVRALVLSPGAPTNPAPGVREA